jgi:hypothetical protein
VRRVVLGSLLVAGALASCSPGLDANGSDPDAGPPLADLYANDPSLAYDLVNDALVLAYDDQSGAFQADTATDTLVAVAPASRAGISRSWDHGATWARVGPIPPADSSCGDPQCALALGAGGTLEPMETDGDVLYAGLAYTDPALAAPDSIATSLSTDSGATWSTPRIAGYIPGLPPGEPSLARSGVDTVIAFTDTVQGDLFLLIAPTDPPTFEPPYLVPISGDDVGVFKAHPVLRLASSTVGFVAYMLPHDDRGTTFDLRVTAIVRTLTPFGYTPWQGYVAYRLDGVTIDPTRPGALGRTWRDDVPLGLTIGYGPHVYVTFREPSSRTGWSEILLLDCDASWLPDCDVQADGSNSFSWTLAALDDRVASNPFTGGKYRPRVSADPFGSAIALSWMQEVQPGSAEVTLAGTVSTTMGGVTFGPAMDLRADSGGPWTPCPTAGLADATDHSYGSHDALVTLPFVGGQDEEPIVIGAHVDSSSCLDLGQLTFDQHVAVTTW